VRVLTEQDKERIRQEVEREFPDDPMMQELHYIRLLRYHELGDLPLEERLREYVRPAQVARA
jgi:hypothetical protein